MTETRPHHRRSNGWSLIELFAIIAILGVVLLVASKVLMTSMAIYRTSHDQLTALNGWNHAVATLRDDVWNASILQLDNNDSELLIRQPNGRSITWRILRSESCSLSRTVTVNNDVIAEQTWQELGHDVAFELDRPVLVLLADRLGVPRADRYAMVSQLQLAQGEHR